MKTKTKRKKRSGPSFKDRLRKMDQFHRQQLLVYVMLFGFMIGESVVLVQLMLVANQYSQNIITLDQFIAEQNKILIGAGVYMGFLLVGIAMMWFWMRLLQVEYEKEQQLFDSKEIVMLINGDTFKYLIQCNPDNSHRVKTVKDMVRLLERSELFTSLYRAYKNGVTVFSFDESNFFKESFAKNVGPLAQDMKAIAGSANHE